VSLAGVADAYSQNADAEPKGIKAHFRVDDSGLLYLVQVYLFLLTGLFASHTLHL